jgi:hypothetical protein
VANRKALIGTASTATLILCNALVGCSAPPQGALDNASANGAPAVKGSAVAHSPDSQFLKGGPLWFLDGTYGDSCTDRSGSWSVPVGIYNGPMDYPAVSVETGDTACTLTVTGGFGFQEELASAPSIQLAAAFQTTASAFVTPSADDAGTEDAGAEDSGAEDGGSGQSMLYVNAELNSTDFSADFTIEVIYSNQPNLVTAAVGATLVQSASSSSSDVPSPDYAVDITGLSIQVDSNNVVQYATGQATLDFNTTAGQAYAVDLGTLPASPTFSQLDAFYNSQTPTALTGTNPTIPASAFQLLNVTLPTVRNLVVANTSNGTNAYEFIAINFNGAL